MSNRAVVYTRVSTEDQAAHGYSLSSQIQACEKYCTDHGWTVVERVTDEGVSGARLDRPGLERVRDLAQAGAIDVVVVYDLDRLSRKTIHQMLLEQELKRHGVDTRYVRGDYSDTDEGQLHKQIRAAIAEYERAKFVERSNRGKREKARRGLVVGSGHIAYGYRHDGEGHLVVVDDQAAIIRAIYKWFVPDRMSINGIVRRLEERGVPSHSGSRGWAKSSVHKILKNETYAGTAYYNKTRRDPAQPSIQSTRPREEWIPVDVPPIINRDLWEAAQERLELNRKRSRRLPRRFYMLRGMLVCGACGRAYSGEFSKGKRYYRDGGRKHRNVRADLLEARVWESVKTFLMDPRSVAEGYQARAAQGDQRAAEDVSRLKSLAQGRAKVERKLDSLTDLFLDPDVHMGKDEYVQRRQKLTDELNGYARQVADIERRREQQTLDEEQIHAVEEFAARVTEGIDLLDDHEKRRVLELLQIQGVVNHDPDGRSEVSLDGLVSASEVGLSSTAYSRHVGQGRVPGRQA